MGLNFSKAISVIATWSSIDAPLTDKFKVYLKILQFVKYVKGVKSVIWLLFKSNSVKFVKYVKGVKNRHKQLVRESGYDPKHRLNISEPGKLIL